MYKNPYDNCYYVANQTIDDLMAMCNKWKRAYVMVGGISMDVEILDVSRMGLTIQASSLVDNLLYWEAIASLNTEVGELIIRLNCEKIYPNSDPRS